VGKAGALLDSDFGFGFRKEPDEAAQELLDELLDCGSLMGVCKFRPYPAVLPRLASHSVRRTARNGMWDTLRGVSVGVCVTFSSFPPSYPDYLFHFT
jgi:hypothetical protein